MISFRIADSPIDPADIREQVRDTACGGFALFEGWVRDHNDGRAVARLEYEVYRPLAVREGDAILREAAAKFEIRHAAAVHRDGPLELTEPAVVVGVSSAHRDAAFRACRYIIDEVKQRLPIWKKEFYADGTTEWVNCRHCTR